MSTPTSGDLLLVNRGGVNYQIDYDDMSTLQDTDLLLVNRAGVNYQIAASDLDLGPDGLILPSVDVLTPVNGAGLNEGASYTPMSSAFVSTDTTPIYFRYWDNTMTVISGGSVTAQNDLFNGFNASLSIVTADAAAVSQAVFTNIPAVGKTGETVVRAYANGGGTIEVLDDDGTTVLRTYTMPANAQDTAIGIVRVNDKIRFTTAAVNTDLNLGQIEFETEKVVDYLIPGRVALQFTDDTDLDKMVAPIIQTDENGNVKVPTTSTVDSTTTIPGENKDLTARWYSDGGDQTYNANDGTGSAHSPVGPRMAWIKEDNQRPTLITDNVAIDGSWLSPNVANAKSSYWSPQLNTNSSVYRVNNGQYNNSGKQNFVHEIGVAPGVLDILSWEGDGTNFREIQHNLGTKPGMILLKKTDSSDSWNIWHKDLKPHFTLDTESQNGQSQPWNSFPSEPTADSIILGNHGSLNGAGNDFVAYAFPADSPGKVKCGTYTGNGANTFIDLGFQPGFVIIKRIDGSTDWVAATTKTGEQYKYWYLNRSDVTMYGNTGDYIGFTGFTQLALNGGNTDFNATGSNYIYLAVAADLTGPSSTQLNLLSGQDLEYFTTGTQITSNAAASGSNVSFVSTSWSGNSSSRDITPSAGGENFFDIRESANNKWLVWIKSHNTFNGHNMYDSERHHRKALYPISPQPETYTGDSNYMFQGPATGNTPGYRLGRSGYTNESGSYYVSWNFKGAPQFFDVQKYIGQEGISSTNKLTINHDLGVEPGCIIIKSANDTTDWQVWHHELSSTDALRLNQTNGVFNVGLTWLEADASSFSFNNSSSNYSSGQRDYISYIFAKDTPYVKCGKYTGAGAGTVVDFGFTPRWVMVKSINGNGSHVIFDETLTNKILYTAMDNEAQGFNFTMDSNGLTMNGNFGSTNYAGYEYTYVAIAAESEGHPPFPPSSTTVTETPDPATATMVVNSESFDVGATASGPALTASITSLAGVEGNSLLADNPTGTWMPGLYAKGSETTVSAPSADEITFTSTNAGSTAFSGVDATLTSRTWTLESGPSATGPWTLVDTYVDYDALASQDGATPWSSNKPALAADTFYRVKVSYDSTNAESVESVYSTFKTSA